MPAARFTVEFTIAAQSDLFKIEEYWIARDEAWRGEKYLRDLASCALQELSDPVQASRGRKVRNKYRAGVREILAFGIYRIIYEVDEDQQKVTVLRFWHAHRDAPPLG